MRAVLATVNDSRHLDRIEAIALERGGVPVERGDSRIVFVYAGVPAAVHSAFDMLAASGIAESARIGVVAGEDPVLASRLAELAQIGSVAIDGTVYDESGVDSARFSLLGERLFPNGGETVRVYTSDASSTTGDRSGPPSGPGAPGIRQRLLELIRARGTRPTRPEAIRLLGLRSETELAELAELERRGFIRPEEDFAIAQEFDEDASDDTVNEVYGGHRSSRGPSAPDAYDGSLGRLLKRRQDLSDSELYELYRVTFEKRVMRERAGLVGHTSSFIGVNAFLAVIWGVTGAGFPWFLFPLFGWGIGWVAHRTGQKAREREYAEIVAMPGADRKQLKAHRKLWKIRRSWRGHLASNLATMALLGMINVVTGSPFPWALIPSAAMGIGLVTHYGTYRRQERDLLEEGSIPALDQRSVRSARRRTSGGTEAIGSAFLVRARAIQNQIEREIDALPEASAVLGSDFRQVLSDYIAQLEVMDRTERDVRALIEDIPINELDREYERLESRLAHNPDAPVAAEYRSSLQQIDRQRKSYRELTSELEMLELRGGSALHALNQLKIDVVRTKNTRGETSSIEDLRARSLEISRYLEDLRSGYEELS